MRGMSTSLKISWEGGEVGVVIGGAVAAASGEEASGELEEDGRRRVGEVLGRAVAAASGEKASGAWGTSVGYVIEVPGVVFCSEDGSGCRRLHSRPTP